jgi:hypothetical protein
MTLDNTRPGTEAVSSAKTELEGDIARQMAFQRRSYMLSMLAEATKQWMNLLTA